MKELLIMSLASILLCGTADAQQRDIRLPEKPKTTNYRDYTQETAGFWCSVEIDAGSSVIFEKKNVLAAGFSYTAGYRFSEYLKVGAGIGARYYITNNDCYRSTPIRWTMPIYANVRGNIISQDNRSVVPYWSFNIGGAVRDGFLVSPTIGIRVGEQRNAFIVGVSYGYNEIKGYENGKKGINFVLIRLGYEF